MTKTKKGLYFVCDCYRVFVCVSVCVCVCSS